MALFVLIKRIILHSEVSHVLYLNLHIFFIMFIQMDVLIDLLNDSNADDILYVIHSYQPLDCYILFINHTFSQKWVFIGNETYRSGKRHSFNDLPAIIRADSTQYWYKNDKIHRDNDLPAIICPDVAQYWYQNDNLHRDNDLPAIVHIDGTQHWCKNDEYHRDNDLPAIIFANGTQYWYKNDKLHRDNDKPAIIYPDGSKEYCINGKRYIPNN